MESKRTERQAPEYRTGHPLGSDMKDVAQYDAFIRQNPEINGGMFRLLCQRQQ